MPSVRHHCIASSPRHCFSSSSPFLLPRLLLLPLFLLLFHNVAMVRSAASPALCPTTFHAQAISTRQLSSVEFFFTNPSVPSASVCALQCAHNSLCQSAVFNHDTRTCALSQQRWLSHCNKSKERFKSFHLTSDGADALSLISCIEQCGGGDGTLANEKANNGIDGIEHLLGILRARGAIDGGPRFAPSIGITGAALPTDQQTLPLRPIEPAKALAMEGKANELIDQKFPMPDILSLHESRPVLGKTQRQFFLPETTAEEKKSADDRKDGFLSAVRQLHQMQKRLEMLLLNAANREEGKVPAASPRTVQWKAKGIRLQRERGDKENSTATVPAPLFSSSASSPSALSSPNGSEYRETQNGTFIIKLLKPGGPIGMASVEAEPNSGPLLQLLGSDTNRHSSEEKPSQLITAATNATSTDQINKNSSSTGADPDQRLSSSNDQTNAAQTVVINGHILSPHLAAHVLSKEEADHQRAAKPTVPTTSVDQQDELLTKSLPNKLLHHKNEDERDGFMKLITLHGVSSGGQRPPLAQNGAGDTDGGGDTAAAFLPSSAAPLSRFDDATGKGTPATTAAADLGGSDTTSDSSSRSSSIVCFRRIRHQQLQQQQGPATARARVAAFATLAGITLNECRCACAHTWDDVTFDDGTQSDENGTTNEVGAVQQQQQRCQSLQYEEETETGGAENGRRPEGGLCMLNSADQRSAQFRLVPSSADRSDFHYVSCEIKYLLKAADKMCRGMDKKRKRTDEEASTTPSASTDQASSSLSSSLSSPTSPTSSSSVSSSPTSSSSLSSSPTSSSSVSFSPTSSSSVSSSPTSSSSVSSTSSSVSSPSSSSLSSTSSSSVSSPSSSSLSSTSSSSVSSSPTSSSSLSSTSSSSVSSSPTSSSSVSSSPTSSSSVSSTSSSVSSPSSSSVSSSLSSTSSSSVSSPSSSSLSSTSSSSVSSSSLSSTSSSSVSSSSLSSTSSSSVSSSPTSSSFLSSPSSSSTIALSISSIMSSSSSPTSSSTTSSSSSTSSSSTSPPSSSSASSSSPLSLSSSSTLSPSLSSTSTSSSSSTSVSSSSTSLSAMSSSSSSSSTELSSSPPPPSMGSAGAADAVDRRPQLFGCFEHIAGFAMRGTAAGLERTVSLEQCECLCANSLASRLYSFQCVSATYYQSDRDCVLNMDSRHTLPNQFGKAAGDDELDNMDDANASNAMVTYIGMVCSAEKAIEQLLANNARRRGPTDGSPSDCAAVIAIRRAANRTAPASAKENSSQSDEDAAALPKPVVMIPSASAASSSPLHSDQCFREQPNYVLEGMALAVETNVTVDQCKCFCADAEARHGSACQSIQFYYGSMTCLLNRENRLSDSEHFNFDAQGNGRHSYFDNRCGMERALSANYLMTTCGGGGGTETTTAQLRVLKKSWRGAGRKKKHKSGAAAVVVVERNAANNGTTTLGREADGGGDGGTATAADNNMMPRLALDDTTLAAAAAAGTTGLEPVNNPTPPVQTADAVPSSSALSTTPTTTETTSTTTTKTTAAFDHADKGGTTKTTPASVGIHRPADDAAAAAVVITGRGEIRVLPAEAEEDLPPAADFGTAAGPGDAATASFAGKKQQKLVPVLGGDDAPPLRVAPPQQPLAPALPSPSLLLGNSGPLPPAAPPAATLLPPLMTLFPSLLQLPTVPVPSLVAPAAAAPPASAPISPQPQQKPAAQVAARAESTTSSSSAAATQPSTTTTTATTASITTSSMASSSDTNSSGNTATASSTSSNTTTSITTTTMAPTETSPATTSSTTTTAATTTSSRGTTTTTFEYPPVGPCRFSALYQTVFNGGRVLKRLLVDSPAQCLAACHYERCRSANLIQMEDKQKVCELFRDSIVEWRRNDVLSFDRLAVHFDSIQCQR